MSRPDLSIIIVNYHSMPELGACLDALEAVRDECAFEVIVVDNGSTDDSLERAGAAHPWCTLIAQKNNLGFAHACNTGVAASQARHVLLLNPDTEVTAGTLAKIVSTLDAHPEWGIVGPRMVDQQGKIYTAARRFPTPWYLFCEHTGLDRCFSRSRLFNGYLYGECDPRALDRVDQIEGSALAISGLARERVGPLDAQFFIFFEEVDWCKRVHDAGFEIHVVQDAVVKHHRSTTMSRFFVESRRHHAESAMKYFRKHHGERGLEKLRFWMLAALRIRMALTWIAGLFSRNERWRIRHDGTQAMLDTYRRGLITA